ncbi:DinB family protein [Catenulispora pinisilvae]|uniref:DinB family protein n=1 Tax=Catenulispora pinisilvae TaxID=2705253 RepID=UPI002B26A4A5|nr:DinB family protein [Catenulispora pinisilvae]
MTSTHTDLLELSDYAWQRLAHRMTGLSDEEYFWEPVADCLTVRRTADGSYRSDGPQGPNESFRFTTLAWRLAHIAGFLREERNGPWLGQPVPESAAAHAGDPGSAAEALAALETSYGVWRTVMAGTTDDSLAAPIGEHAGPYGAASRRSFALHVLDELIHHGAEAALLRDLYRAR